MQLLVTLVTANWLFSGCPGGATGVRGGAGGGCAPISLFLEKNAMGEQIYTLIFTSIMIKKHLSVFL